eukprot:UN01661
MQISQKDIYQYLAPDFQDKPYEVQRVQLIELARLSENAERFEDMCKLVKAIIELDSKRSETTQIPVLPLNTDERNLLSVAYKHVVSSRRTSWRTFNTDEGRTNPFIAEYRTQLEAELHEICREVLDLLELHLIPAQKNLINTLMNAPGVKIQDINLHKEGMVFYLKLCGDYYRYLAEFQDREVGSHEKARHFYSEAYSLAKSRTPGMDEEILPRTNPVRLGLALNFSVCFYEILEERDQACALAREAFDAALAKLDDLDEHQYKDSTLILMLLRDNLTLWSESFLNRPNHDEHMQ